jgi:hypothetical protein
MRPSTAPRRRAPVNRLTTVMDHRTRANSDAMKGLLGRQLASITDVLAKASQRRDADTTRRSFETTTSSPVQMSDTYSPASNPSLISDNSTFGGSGATLRGRFDVDVAQACCIMG